MIDLADLRERPDAYKKGAKDKGITIDIDAFLKLDEQRRTLVPSVEQMRSEQNAASKKIPTLEGAPKEKMLTEMKTLSDTLKKEEGKLKKIEAQWEADQLQLPSIPLDKVPIGKDESENVKTSSWGDKPTFDFEPKDHVTLGEALDIIDIPRGVKVSGSRSYFLKGEGARLHQAVLRFTMDHLHAKGWTLFSPPLMANYDCFMGTGFFPGMDQANIYAIGGQEEKDAPIEGDDLYLIGTSEVTVASYHKDEILKAEDLPKRYAGYSMCFRREAGTWNLKRRLTYVMI